MYRKIISAIILVIGLFGAHSAISSPLTFYWNEAAWLQAVSGYRVGTYPYGIIRTDYVWILDYDPNSYYSIAGFEINPLNSFDWSNGSFQPNFFADFFSAGSYID